MLRPAGGFWAIGGRLTWVAGLVLAVSAFMGWYAEHGLAGPTIAVIGWHTGTLGKLVFFIGLALLVIAILAEVGIELPPSDSRQPGRDRARLARDDLRPDPADLDPGLDPAARGPRDRDLDQPARGSGRDRRRALASIRRAVATEHAEDRAADACRAASARRRRRGRSRSRREARTIGTASRGEAHASTAAHSEGGRRVPGRERAGVRHADERPRLRVDGRRAGRPIRLCRPSEKRRGDVGGQH